ncbi:ABC transporter permease [Starkeya koreensis]|uniref:ABC transporter permease n=1 Tax=Ancylobacter koreensis TaxID=266121 RepID=A0ABT0DHI6_9HYPH|nr:ABC transporter permease [Ancylobacter koreensis]MCK0206741.1 ABC transporter permease [Ancylobacter koreensis]
MMKISRQERMGLGLVAPSFFFLLVFFIIPAILLFVCSFWMAQAFRLIPAFTFDNYARALSNTGFYFLTWNALKNGLCTAVLTVVLSFPAAYFIVYRTRGNLLFYLILVSWFSSYLVRIYAWRVILGSNGLINTTLMQLGLIDQPLEMLLFSPFATIVTLTHIMLPFGLLLLVSALRDVKKEYVEAARDLGASQTEVLTRVILPMCYKGVVGAFMFTFVISAGDFVTPQLLGGRDGMTTGILIANQFRTAGNWPFGAAMAFLLLAAFLVVYLGFVRLLDLLRLAPGRRFHD